MREVPKTNSVSEITREGWWSNREVGRSLMGLLRDQESIKGTSEDRQESVVSWKRTVEHFRRRVCPEDFSWNNISTEPWSECLW